jgi:hypothetical protein
MVKIQCTDMLIEIDSSGSRLVSNILDDNDEIVPVPYHSTLVYNAFDENLDLNQKETQEISKILECANFLDVNLTFDKICNNPDKSWDWDGISQNPNIIVCNIY